MNEKKIAVIFKAFCDENRIRIIKSLRSGEKCACRLLEEIDVTIVVGRKEGKWTHYSISQKGVEQAKNCLGFLTTMNVENEKESCCGK